ncbi:MAG: hypothetical protein QM731_05630 [Chitinophagaceae bacterium]
MRTLPLLFCTLTLLAVTHAKGQDLNATASVTKLMFENSKMKVTEFMAEPGKDICGTGKHGHPAHLTIIVTDAKIKLIKADGRVIETQVAAGSSFWSEAETHQVINNGDKPVKVYIVEPKQ